MAINTLLLALTSLLSAVVGAGAALLGQVLTRKSNASLADRRLASEERRHAADLEARSAEMLFESRRILFANIIALAGERIEMMSAPLYLGAGELAPNQTFNTAAPEWIDRWRARRSELELLAPGLRGELEQVADSFKAWGDEIGPNYAINGMTHLHAITQAVTALENGMQKLLRTV